MVELFKQHDGLNIAQTVFAFLQVQSTFASPCSYFIHHKYSLKVTLSAVYFINVHLN